MNRTGMFRQENAGGCPAFVSVLYHVMTMYKMFSDAKLKETGWMRV
ncbi:hypothetical protein HMPREF9442_02799 [Paraprevotella xylaniphila YIT 11841]|uniref:Uncharacterized protein n=1 Tax=Paraprevotella xylaniphila YIT 11841 TaxID=762982 RepID=F3QX65_9BACT|nr:hypothetical protein HMPREF9442_02799 [Paraprevotella xylaniphila YIT 11841]